MCIGVSVLHAKLFSTVIFDVQKYAAKNRVIAHQGDRNIGTAANHITTSASLQMEDNPPYRGKEN